MNVLFWNTSKNNDANKYILSLVEEYNVDALVLAEYKANKNDLLNYLSSSKQMLKFNENIGCDRIMFFSNYSNVSPGPIDDYYAIHVINNSLILCGVHLMSDIDSDNTMERNFAAERIRNDVESLRAQLCTDKVILIGDFNEMPYGTTCLSAGYLHGLPVHERGKTYRQVKQQSYIKYYNPMWNLFGDNVYPPGTYYYNSAKHYCPMWYMLDQMILSWELVEKFDKKSLRIITQTGKYDFRDRMLRPNKKISDHFPIIASIAI